MPYTRLAYRHVQALERRQGESLRDMHDLLFHRQKALAAEDLREYAAQVELGAEPLAAEVEGSTHLARVERE